MQKGTINVTTENIFPIIKKFLYSDHDIFLREIVSNATDATQKLSTLASVGEFKGELGDNTIVVSLDKDKKTITISDKGIGMTEEELKKYITEIAFSSAQEFLDKYKDKAQSIIGHFGLGFYSAFMVSKKVEVITRSWKDGSKGLHWTCEGDPSYTLEESDKSERGTDIVLHIDDESVEFLNENRINELLKKYCRFLPVPIAFGKEKSWKDGKESETDKLNIINDTNPLWNRNPNDIKEEEYIKFYHELHPMQEDPLFWIHLFVDYPFKLTGILYFPRVKNSIELQKNKIRLFCNQVYVTDSVEGIVPDFLTLLHGVIDSPDIPLNISRSYLQSDSNVKKISSHISKKVADKLQELFKNNRSDFDSKWDELKVFIQYGMITDEKFYERAEKFALLKNTDSKYFTFEDYANLIKPSQTDKNNQLIYLYTTNLIEQYSKTEAAKAKGYDVLVMDGHLDAHFINQLEQKFKDSRFMRVDAEIADKLIVHNDDQEHVDQTLSHTLDQIFKTHLPEKSGHFLVQCEALSEQSDPLTITHSEFMRRMKDMSALSGGDASFYGKLPDSYNLIVNTNHPIIKRIIKESDEKIGKHIEIKNAEIKALETEKSSLLSSQKDKNADEIPVIEKDKQKDLESKINTKEQELNNHIKEFSKDNHIAKQLMDIALLTNNMLKGEDLNLFIKRSLQLIK